MDEHHTSFEYPADALLSRVRDHFLRKYAGDISEEDAHFLAKIFSDVQPEDLVSVNERRVASQKMAEILCACDSAMAGSKDPKKTWGCIGLALGLPSACQFNGNTLAKQSGVSKMAISKSAKRLREAFDVPPAFDHHGSLSFGNLQH